MRPRGVAVLINGMLDNQYDALLGFNQVVDRVCLTATNTRATTLSIERTHTIASL